MKSLLLAACAALAFASTAAAQPARPPAALFTDPPADAANPASSQVLHIPSGGVQINGLAYLAAGAGPHPTAIILHGLPGNEKNLDLAQAVRRAGWNAVTSTIAAPGAAPGPSASRATSTTPRRCWPTSAIPPTPSACGSTPGGW